MAIPILSNNKKTLIVGASHVWGWELLNRAKVLPNFSDSDLVFGVHGLPLFSKEMKDYIESKSPTFDQIVLFVSDFRYGNYLPDLHQKLSSSSGFVGDDDFETSYFKSLGGFASPSKKIISIELDSFLYENGLKVLDYFVAKYEEKIKFVFWDLNVREAKNVKKSKYFNLGKYFHPTWNYFELLEKYRVNTLDVSVIRRNLDDYIYDDQGNPSYKGFYFLWNLILTSNMQTAYQIAEERFNLFWNGLFEERVYNDVHGSKMYKMPIESGFGGDLNKYEQYESKLVQLITSPSSVVIDIGANIGFYSMQFASLSGRSGKVYAFEPDRDNFKVLERNIELNSYVNVIAERMAVSNQSGVLKLYQSDMNIGMHRCYGSVLCSQDYQVVPCVSLDEYFEEGFKVDLIKIDIEGFEAYAFNGMKRILHENPNVKIITEFCPFSLREARSSSLELFDFLIGFGFSVYSIDETLCEVDINEMREQLMIFEALPDHVFSHVQSVTKSNISSIESDLLNKLEQFGYKRKILENFLFIKGALSLDMSSLGNQFKKIGVC